MPCLSTEGAAVSAPARAAKMAMLALKYKEAKALLAAGRGATFRLKQGRPVTGARVLMGSLSGRIGRAFLVRCAADQSAANADLRWTIAGDFLRFGPSDGSAASHSALIVPGDSEGSTCVVRASDGYGRERVSQELRAAQSAGSLRCTVDGTVLSVDLSSGHFKPQDLAAESLQESIWLSRFVKAWVTQHQSYRALLGAQLRDISGSVLGELDEPLIRTLLVHPDPFEAARMPDCVAPPPCFPPFVEALQAAAPPPRRSFFSRSGGAGGAASRRASRVGRSLGFALVSAAAASPSPRAPQRRRSPVLDEVQGSPALARGLFGESPGFSSTKRRFLSTPVGTPGGARRGGENTPPAVKRPGLSRQLF